MTNRVLLAILSALMCTHAWAEDGHSFPVIYLSRQTDPSYEAVQSYEGTVFKVVRRPIAGVQSALKEAHVLGRTAKLEFPLVEEVVPDQTDIVTAVTSLAAANKNAAFVLDLPFADTDRLAQNFKDRTDLILLNVRQEADVLRGADCSSAMFHSIASMAMRTDAMAQYLFAMNWRNVLVIGSTLPEDVAMKASFLRSAQKFGLSIAADKVFIAGNDPREREKNDPKLITSGVDYDVIFLADDDGNFSRNLSYSTYLPRPIVGAEGLIASSWHWTFERNGAPQLNQRIRKFAGGDPSDGEWAAWVAVRAVVEAVVASKSTNIGAVRDTLLSPDFSFDLYKVGPGSFRSWDHQLRQPLLLHTYDAVVATAPVEGFLHQYNTFDTLGRDQPETDCHFKE